MASKSTDTKVAASKAKATPKAKAKATVERAALAPKDEKRVAAVIEAYPDQPWAERYARKVAKVQAGLRTTPAPIPPELGKEAADEIDAMLNYERPKREAKPKAAKPAAKKTPAKKAPAKTAAKPKAKATKEDVVEAIGDILEGETDGPEALKELLRLDA